MFTVRYDCVQNHVWVSPRSVRFTYCSLGRTQGMPSLTQIRVVPTPPVNANVDLCVAPEGFGLCGCNTHVLWLMASDRCRFVCGVFRQCVFFVYISIVLLGRVLEACSLMSRGNCCLRLIVQQCELYTMHAGRVHLLSPISC